MAHTLKESNISLNKEKSTHSLFDQNNYRLMNVRDLFNEVQQNIHAWGEFASREDFYQMKLTLCSEALREGGTQHIGFQVEIPSTVFGELSEKFKWSFDIEGNSDVGNLEERVYKKAQILKEKAENHMYSTDTFVRMHSLLGLENEIKQVFNLIDKQLNYKVPEKALILTSLIFFELELLSSKRETDYLLIDNMYSLSNPNDRWLACMSISAEYIKPSNNYMSHLMH